MSGPAGLLGRSSTAALRSAGFLVLFAAGVRALAADSPAGGGEWTVIRGRAEFEEAARGVSRYLSRVSEGIGRGFSDRLDAVKTAGEAAACQADWRAKIWAWLGELPERTPLRPKVTGTLNREGYRIEKVVFESRPRYYVTATVYVPERVKSPRPAILCPVGHWDPGKATEDYQRFAVYMVRRGFLVMVYDLPGMGERLEYFDSVYRRPLVALQRSENIPVMEHSLQSGHAILASGSFGYYLLWDGLRAIDYLSSRPEVDTRRIACTGASGGGWQTELLAALDTRISVAIPVVYGGCVADDLNLPGLGQLDLQPLGAPRPMLLIVATGDREAKRSWQFHSYQKAAILYRAMGVSDRIQFSVVESKHAYSAPMYPLVYEWLRKWFDLPPGAAADGAEAIELAETLSATLSGQVKTSLGGETVASLSRADGLRYARKPQLPRASWSGGSGGRNSAPESPSGWRSPMLAPL